MKQLNIRLSDTRSWASNPAIIRNADDLRYECLEAFVQLRCEWRKLVDWKIPPHQTIKRSLEYSLRPRTLYVQINHSGSWHSQPWTPKIAEPNLWQPASNDWANKNWQQEFDACIKTLTIVERISALADWVAA